MALKDSTVTFKPVLLPQRTMEFAFIQGGIFSCGKLSRVPGHQNSWAEGPEAWLLSWLWCQDTWVWSSSFSPVVRFCLLAFSLLYGRLIWGQVTHSYTSVQKHLLLPVSPQTLGHTWAPSCSAMSHHERQWKLLCGLLLLLSTARLRPRSSQSPQNCTPELQLPCYYRLNSKLGNSSAWCYSHRNMDPRRRKCPIAGRTHGQPLLPALVICIYIPAACFYKRQWKDSRLAGTQAISYLTCWIEHCIFFQNDSMPNRLHIFLKTWLPWPALNLDLAHRPLRVRFPIRVTTSQGQCRAHLKGRLSDSMNLCEDLRGICGECWDF